MSDRREGASAEDVRFESIRFSGSGGDAIEGTATRAGIALGAPSGGLTPGVLLVRGSAGFDALARRAAERLARAGFAVLVPELARGPRATEVVSEVVPDRRALGDLEGAAAALVEQLGVARERVGVVGLGEGGVLAFLCACTSRRVAAAVSLCGSLVRAELTADRPHQPLELALNLSVPFLAVFGERDPATPRDGIERLRRVSSQFALSCDIVVLPDSAGFLDEGGEERRAAEEGWKQTLAFLHEHLDRTES